MESRMRDVRGLAVAVTPEPPAGGIFRAGPSARPPAQQRALSAGAPWGPHPAVLHLDIDAFFASVEQLRNPALRGRPVVVGAGVVASASYEARAFGIRAGTPLPEARRLCPEALLLPGHAQTYRAFAERIFSLAAELSPALETFLDDVLVELTGTEHLHGHLIRACARLQRRVREETGLSISLGLGSNRMVARMLTRLAKPGGFAWLRPGGEMAFVGRRPIEELPGVGPHRARLLRQMGIETIAQVRELSSVHLRDLFGDIGFALAARARGRETCALHPGELPRSIRRETSFEEPQTESAALEGMLHYLLERGAAQARRLDAEPRALRVHLRWADGESAGRRETLAGEAACTQALFARAQAILRGLRDRRTGVRNLGVELSQLRGRRRDQFDLFAEAEEESASRALVACTDAPPRFSHAAEAGAAKSQKQLDGVVDRVREQFGFRALVRGPSLALLEKLPSDTYGFVLRTPCLTR